MAFTNSKHLKSWYLFPWKMDLIVSEILLPRLREISDIAKRQVEILNVQQQSREKEVESIRMQLLDYQVSIALTLLCRYFLFF